MTNPLQWYVVQVYSGSEKKVAEAIREQVETNGLTDKIVEVLVPAEQIVEIKRGEKVNTERNYFPGYILINMIVSDETWHLIKNTPKVTNFLGGKGTKPIAISKAEVQRLMTQVEERSSKPKHQIFFDIGQQVRVCDGPFNSFNGIVEEVDEERERLKVSVLIFGRPTPVELEYIQVEKIN